jgi:hypothetical protein
MSSAKITSDGDDVLRNRNKALGNLSNISSNYFNKVVVKFYNSVDCLKRKTGDRRTMNHV